MPGGGAMGKMRELKERAEGALPGLTAMLAALYEHKGGPGSGNWGHIGRPGSVGGSAPTTGVGAAMSLTSGPTAAERRAAAQSQAEEPKELTEEQTIDVLVGQFGGKLWENYGKRRVYFDAGSVARHGGLDWSSYGTGNISSARLNGSKISNSAAKRIFEALHSFNFKIWYDLTDGKLYSQTQYEKLRGDAKLVKDSFVAKVKRAIGKE